MTPYEKLLFRMVGLLACALIRSLGSSVKRSNARAAAEAIDECAAQMVKRGPPAYDDADALLLDYERRLYAAERKR